MKRADSALSESAHGRDDRRHDDAKCVEPVMNLSMMVIMIAEDEGQVCAHVRVDAPEIDALAIIETRFEAAEGTDIEDWKLIARELAGRMLAHD